MKPTLVIPPAPARWPAIEDLLRDQGHARLRDLERRLVEGVPGAQDAYAIIAAGGNDLACAGIHKSGHVGVLAPCFTRPEHRRRGYARQLIAAVLSWFEMTGGKWLFVSATAELDEGVYRKFGFFPLRRIPSSPHDRLTLWRSSGGVGGSPLEGLRGEVTVRPLTRADWPAMVALLQFRPASDPRVSLEESATHAEAFTLELLDHQERGACGLLGACQGSRLIGFVSVATDRPGERTFALRVPHDEAPPALAEVALAFASSKGYAHVDFPMDHLVPAEVGGTPTSASEPTLGGDEEPPPVA